MSKKKKQVIKGYEINLKIYLPVYVPENMLDDIDCINEILDAASQYGDIREKSVVPVYETIK